jgi:two-component system LytT family response regulator
MRALVVDDEPLARRELGRLLAAFPAVQVVGEAGNIDEARERIEALTPDVVFLDIQMPGGTGFDLLAQLDRLPRIVFTTAYDYLLKPVEPERLATAIRKIQESSPRVAATAGTAPLEQLFIKDGPRCWFVPLRQVSLLTSEGNYVRLHWGQERPLLGRSLSSIEQKLDPRQFFRANRAQIINLEFIQQVEAGEGGRLYVQLRDGPEIEVSRRQAREFKERTTID